MRSSYQENNFGAVLQTAVRLLRPLVVVELGVLDGYSTQHLAQGIQWLNTHYHRTIPARLYAFDLFEDYSYNHGDKAAVEAMLAEKGLAPYVRIQKMDAFRAHTEFGNRTVNLLHIDISNDGASLLQLLKNWEPKLADRSSWVLLEGGSKERDQIEWMRQYSKPPIRSLFNTEFVQKVFYAPMVLEQFPSMTLLQRRSSRDG